ncbi:Rpn family recombination-promoting nuclease/putative transposase [Chloroflexi bacterium TSY]|nr:Rpn family recombination-promoting nuclease/putative transposase [Chloroflexi bacterium TSY]
MAHTVHDSGYKRLFSNKTIFRQLIETFVEEDWVQELDFDEAIRLDKSFISEHYKETESDIIYGVPLIRADGTQHEVYFYILGVVHFSWIDRFTLLETERTFIFSDFAGSQRENGLI